MEDTRYIFAKGLKELLKKQPLDKVSVTDLVKVSGKTRQTFYRYFEDKYALVNWYFKVLADQSFLQIGEQETLKEGLTKKFEFILEDQLFFEAAFLSKDYNNVEHYDYECIYHFYEGILKKKCGQIPDDILFLLKMYCHGSITMTVDWAIHGMKRSPEELAQYLIDALPPKLEYYLSDLK